MGKLPIAYGNEIIGEADIAQDGLYMRLRVSVKPRRGLWRAWAIGDAGEIPIGTLEPVNGKSAISRRFSRQALSKAGELLRVELRPAENAATLSDVPHGTEARPKENAASAKVPQETEAQAWRRSVQGQRLFWNVRFQRQLRNVREALTRTDGERRRVALIRDENAPFPLPELFCLASAARIGAKDYWVFSFDRQGWPVL